MKNWPRLTFAVVLCLALGLAAAPTRAAQTFSPLALNPPTAASPHPILSDLKVRQALASCTDKPGLVKAAYPWLSDSQAADLVMDTFLPKEHWAYDATTPKYAYDVSLGNNLLEEDGWTLAPGETYREKDGKELALVGSTTDAAVRKAWMAAWEEQLKLCGIHLIRDHQPTSWFFGNGTGLRVRDFEIGAYAVYLSEEYPNLQWQYSCEYISIPQRNWFGDNFSGWCNPNVDEAIQMLDHSLAKSERVGSLRTIQEEFVQDVPVIPLFQRLDFGIARASMTGVDFSDYSSPRLSYAQSAQNWQIPGETKIVLGTPWEPASLFIYPDFVGSDIYQLINPSAYTYHNFEFQPLLLTQMPTLESGLAHNSSVTVQAGDRVMLVAGYGTESLRIGDQLWDENGNLVTFDGTPVRMKQLTVQYPFKNGIHWSDGAPLLKEDFMLGYTAMCSAYPGGGNDKCRRTSQIVFADDGSGYTVTWIPGDQSPTHYLPPFPWYPAHQVIVTPGPYAGMTLSQVPYWEWMNLPEITEHPLGVGPYQVSEWIKGDHMTLTAVPGYVNGAPLTEKLVIKFIKAAEVEDMLLDGEVDVLRPEVIRDLSPALIDAQAQGRIKIYPIPSYYEHADINLETFEVSAEVSPTSGGALNYTNWRYNDAWMNIPAGAVTEPTTIEFRMTSTPVNSNYMDPRDALIPFRIRARHNGVPVNELTFNQPLQVEIHINNDNYKYPHIPFYQIKYYRVDGTNWSDAVLTCPEEQRRFEYNVSTGFIILNVCQTGEYIAMGEYSNISLPIIRR